MRQHKLLTNAEMSEFPPGELELLGCGLSGDGIRPDLEKIQAVHKRKVPRTHGSEVFFGSSQLPPTVP